MLELLTFTGVDSRTDFGHLQALAQQYPQVEFGILVGTATGKDDNGIFPPLATVQRLKEFGLLNGRHTALHLCGAYSRAVMLGQSVVNLYAMCRGFSRVQVNLHGDAFKPDRIDVSVGSLTNFADKALCDSIILQHRSNWESVPVRHKKVEYLFDLSEGGGIASFDQWPKPPEWLARVGYAGGIGPSTITEAMQFINAHGWACTWLDMESRVRTQGWLDLTAVKTVCAAVFPECDEGEC